MTASRLARAARIAPLSADDTAPQPPNPSVPATAPRDLDARAIAVMLLLCSLWALQQVSLKAVAAEASPEWMVALRSLIALALLLAWMGWTGWRHRAGGQAPAAPVVQRERWAAGALAGSLFALEFLLVSLALRLTSASHVVVFLYTSPIFAALGLQARLPAERLGRVAWAGIVLATAGIAVAFLGGSGLGGSGAASASHGAAGAQAAATGLLAGLDALHGPWRTLAGDALALAAGAAWGATTVTIRSSRLASAPATETLIYQLVGAAALLLPVALLSPAARWSASATVLAHLLFQGVVVSFASFLAWFQLLREYRAAPLGVFALMTPLMGVLGGVSLLGEPLHPAFGVGGLTVMAGLILVVAQAPVTRWLSMRR